MRIRIRFYAKITERLTAAKRILLTAWVALGRYTHEPRRAPIHRLTRLMKLNATLRMKTDKLKFYRDAHFVKIAFRIEWVTRLDTYTHNIGILASAGIANPSARRHIRCTYALLNADAHILIVDGPAN